jgi:hypothetical protein
MNTVTNMPELKRYLGRIKARDGTLFGTYEDWLTDDDDARATYRTYMQQQGYKVKTITVQNQLVIIEIQ